MDSALLTECDLREERWGREPPVCVHAAIFVARFLMALMLPLPHVWDLPWLVKQGN